MFLPRRRRMVVVATVVPAVAATVFGAGVVTAMHASAAAGCRIDYEVTNSWQGGFGANVNVHNLGDPINGWTLLWSYGAGQTVTQA